MSRCRCVAVPILSLVVVTLFAGERLVAAEPTREFVEALRQQGHFDEAHAELERWSKREDLPAEIATIVDFERGLTLMAQSRSTPSGKERFENAACCSRLL